MLRAPAVALAGCGSPTRAQTKATATPPAECPQGTLQPFAAAHITAADAIARARSSSRFVDVISVEAAHIRDFELQGACGSADLSAVWAVVVDGTFPPASCGPVPLPGQSPHPCPPPASTGVIFLDYHSGAELEAQFPAPARYKPPPGWSTPSPP